jgi:hypothetical protein
MMNSLRGFRSGDNLIGVHHSQNLQIVTASPIPAQIYSRGQ